MSAYAAATDGFGRAERPYQWSSPWNTPIPLGAALDPRSEEMVATILASSTGKLRSDPTQYSFPVYFADAATPRVTMECTGIVSVNRADGTRVRAGTGHLEGVPIPPEAAPSAGSDGQLIVIDTDTGDEYDIWRFVPPAGCANMVKYERGVHRSAVEPMYTARGAGVPLLAGIIRPWEIAQGRIEHALAFGYPLSRSGRCVWPASKTDGNDDHEDAIPQGARLRLDPTLNVDDIPGLDPVGRVIARALQEYGMILIDNSGANKVYAEDELTAGWGSQLGAMTVGPIPVERLQVLRLPDAYRAEDYAPGHGRCVRETAGGAFGRAERPYEWSSPWNTPIPIGAALDARSDEMVATILASSTGKLRSDPTRHSFPVYFADAATPRVTMECTGIVSVNRADGTRVRAGTGQLEGVPVPPEAAPSAGSEGQLIVIDTESGDEYDIWRFVPPAGCTNMVKYERGVHRSAVEPMYTARGAGVPLLAGIIRPWEIAQGRIEHALAFGYPLSRSERCVWPASKTNGNDDREDAIPQGARLRLDPTLNVDDIPGLDPVGRVIARALQEYGMILIDNSGANKIYAEDELTAGWGSQLVATTVSAIPVERLQVLRLPGDYRAESYSPDHGGCVN